MKQSFITSYLTFYLKAAIALEGHFVKVSNPNTILKLIPLGSTNRTIPLEQISSINDNFKLHFKSFLWGLILAFIGFRFFTSDDPNIIIAIILLAWGVLTVLSSFQADLVLTLTSGQLVHVSVIIFEKGKLLNCVQTIQSLISKRYDDTNVTANTDRMINSLNNLNR